MAERNAKRIQDEYEKDKMMISTLNKEKRDLEVAVERESSSRRDLYNEMDRVNS